MAGRIRLSESVYILKESENFYRVVFTATRVIKRFKVDGLVKDVITILLSEHDPNKILQVLAEKYAAVVVGHQC